MVVAVKPVREALTDFARGPEIERRAGNLGTLSVRNKPLVNVGVSVGVNYCGVIKNRVAKAVEVKIRVICQRDWCLSVGGRMKVI